MAQPTKAVNTIFKGDGFRFVSVPLSASNQVYKGSILCPSADGYWFMTTGSISTLTGSAVAEETTIGGATNGAVFCKVRQGCLAFFAQDGSVTNAKVGQPIFANDGQTVSLNSVNGTKQQVGVMDDSLLSGSLVGVKFP